MRYSTSIIFGLLSFVAVLVSSTSVARALDTKRNLTQYHHRVWQDRDGLPQNTILSIAQTPDGFLWLGTEVGLARFDGVRFIVYDKKNTPEMLNNYVATLLSASDGSLWIGTRVGLTKLEGGKFTSFTKENGIANDSIRALIEDRNGTIWIGTDNGLTRLKDGTFETFGRRAGLPSDSIRSLHEDSEGVIWVGTSDGLARITDERIEDLTDELRLPSQTVRAIASDSLGLWIGVENGGLHRFADGRTQVFSEKDGLSSRSIRALKHDKDGNLWIGTDGGGLNRFGSETFKAFSGENSLPQGNFVRTIFEDREGSVWFGTEGGGLNQLQNGKVLTLTVRDGLSTDFTRVILQDGRGRTWIGTEGGGLNVYEAGVLRKFSASELPSDTVITCLIEDRLGDLWIGTEEEGLWRLDGSNRLRKIGREDGFQSSTVTALHASRDGSVWIGTYSGLVHFAGGISKTFTTQNGLPANHVRSLFEDREGNIWIGTRDRGLARLTGGIVAAFGKDRGMVENATITDFLEEQDGTLWISTNAGLARRTGESFSVLTTDHGLPSNNIHRILDDGTGHLWLSSGKGIFRVSKDDLKNASETPSTRLSSIVFTTADGMKSSECSGEGQPAGWHSADGTLWFPTVKGVVIIDPNRIVTNNLPPQVYLDRIEADKALVDFSSRVELAASVGELNVNYTATSLLAPENVRFKYKLDGLDEDWIDAGTRRTAYYTNLPPGDYYFRVAAANNDGVWSERDAGIAIVKHPYFSQTYYFYALCAALVLLLAWFAYLYRLRALKHEFAAVMAERKRIAREWHDTLVAGIAAISWQLDASSEKLAKEPRVARDYLEIARKMVNHSLTEARRALWDLRSNTVDETDLSKHLNETALQLTTGRDAHLEFATKGTPHRLSGEATNNLLRIGQEAVNNAIKHADAKIVSVELAFTQESVKLRVTDDGRGFVVGNDANGNGHFGIIGMRERARKLGGTFVLESVKGKGTEVLVEVPIKID